ncbi:XdhC family protein [Pectinatus cerevisiiphilus]|uniref:Xanthine dehydrogenase accessory factor n=1 Tax=Pectinatus cerevisiiphilus TaxID=86956 RepID=A0A4R3K7Q9_9FIRM|nr:XdhC/CoxI family protein [Pectinatus cerevisiiphilus]TCS79006.1 xanthine dehydrogenase accessory factor [Pectinatus cerevisiiphilus]
MKEIYKKILDLYKQKKTFYIVTALTPKIDEKFLAEYADVKKMGVDPDREKLPKVIVKDEKKYFIESINNTPTVVIAGGGHVALAIAKLAKFLEFDVVVIDDRAEFVTQERFPYAQRYAEDVETALQRDFGADAYYVIVTRGHKDDFRALNAVLAKKYYRYVGMIGSKQKVGITMKKLEAKGYPQQTLEQIHAPIGLSIGAITPEEIAVSILAEIIEVKSAFVGDRSQHNVFTALEKISTSQLKQNAAIATIIEKHGSSPRGVGSKMLVTEKGEVFGSIGGGAVEYAAQKKCAEISSTKTATLIEYDLGLQNTSKLGMICGGRIKVLIEPIN